MSETKPLSLVEKGILALALTWAAGFVDAVGYVSLFHVFTANMSGNTVAMGMGLSAGHWHDAFHRGFPIAMFMAGLFAGGVLIEAMQRKQVRQVLALSIGLEAFFLVVSMLLGTRWPQHVNNGAAGPVALAMIAFMSIAMGVQNTSIRKVGALSVHTTHVTGELTHLSEVMVNYFFWMFDRHRAGIDDDSTDRPSLIRASLKNDDFRKGTMLTVLWTLYLGGAIVAALCMSRWADWALVAPILVLIGVILLDMIRPVEIEKSR